MTINVSDGRACVTFRSDLSTCGIVKRAEAVRQAGKAGRRSVLLGARKSAARATGTDAHHIEVAVTLARRAAAADAAAAELQRVGGLGGVPKAFKRAPRAARALRLQPVRGHPGQRRRAGRPPLEPLTATEARHARRAARGAARLAASRRGTAVSKSFTGAVLNPVATGRRGAGRRAVGARR